MNAAFWEVFLGWSPMSGKECLGLPGVFPDFPGD